MSGQPQPLIDAGNPWHAIMPCSLVTGRARLANPATGLAEEFSVVTMRVGNGTLTAYLTKAEAEAWAGSLAGCAAKMTGLALGGPGMPGPGPNGSS